MQTAGKVTGGVKSAIGGTALQLTATSQKLNNGVYVQAPSGNTQPVYIGPSGVTTGNGFAIAAGVTSPLIQCDDPSTLYAISSGSQELRWIGG